MGQSSEIPLLEKSDESSLHSDVPLSYENLDLLKKNLKEEDILLKKKQWVEQLKKINDPIEKTFKKNKCSSSDLAKKILEEIYY